MPDLKEVRTSLEVGFTAGSLPERFIRYRGRATRSLEVKGEFPYEDAQFQVVMIDALSLTQESVREVHRVLRPEGWLFFEIAEGKYLKNSGKSLSDIFALLKDGFNIVEVERASWWSRWRGNGVTVISAQKKRWRTVVSLAGRGA